MGKFMSKFGDWTRAGVVLQSLRVNLVPAFKAQIQEDGELILQTMIEHIDAQDLDWTPLAEKTVELKHGDTTIYVETGFLRNALEVRKIKSPASGFTLFIGASAWKRTPEGVRLSDLMIWLEYGTEKMPPRPLIRPTWEEVKPLIKSHWKVMLKDLIETGGRVR
jgi:hypothetical protein